MATDKLPEILIFLTRGSISFFEPKDNFSKVLSVPETMVKDLEVINPDGLSAWIGSFLDKEKLGATETLIVVSESISFTRDIPFGEENKKGVLVQDFTDTVPLEAPEVKVFRTPEFDRVIAVNPKYYQVLIELLVARGFAVAGVIPASVIPEVGAAAEITMDIAGKVLGDFEKVKFQNFIEVSAADLQVSAPIITTGSPKGSRIYILAGVFILGAIVLLALIFLRK